MNKVDFLGHKVSKLIVGDNSMTGHSYIEDIAPGADMKKYYTAENIKAALRKIQANGINTMVPLAHPYMTRVFEEFQYDGGEMQFIWQPWVNTDKMTDSIRDLPKSLNTIATYHQGTTTDYHYERGEIDIIKDNIKALKEFGVPVGIGTHYPEVVERAEEEDWGADFYMACMQNARRGRKGEQSGFITGKTKAHIRFFPEDRPIMLETLKKVEKPVIAFKIFAGGQMFVNKTEEEVNGLLKGVYEEVFSALKPNDIAAMGVFQRDNDQITQNIKMYEEWYAEKNK